MEREVLPSPKATECALMHSGREHTVSPESTRESGFLKHTHTIRSFHITTAQLFKMSKRTLTLLRARSHNIDPDAGSVTVG